MGPLAATRLLRQPKPRESGGSHVRSPRRRAAAVDRPAAGRSADSAGPDGGLHELRLSADRARVRRGGAAGHRDGQRQGLRLDGRARGRAPRPAVGRGRRAAAAGRADVGQRSGDAGESRRAAGARVQGQRRRHQLRLPGARRRAEGPQRFVSAARAGADGRDHRAGGGGVRADAGDGQDSPGLLARSRSTRSTSRRWSKGPGRRR